MTEQHEYFKEVRRLKRNRGIAATLLVAAVAFGIESKINHGLPSKAEIVFDLGFAAVGTLGSVAVAEYTTPRPSGQPDDRP